MRDINEILDKVKYGNGKLSKLLESIDFDFDADEFIVRDYDEDQLSDENPEMDKEEIENLLPLLCPALNGDGQFKYNGHDYDEMEDDIYDPEYLLCLYNDNDWTLIHKLSNYVSKEKMVELEIPEEYMDKLYVQCTYMGFGR